MTEKEFGGKAGKISKVREQAEAGGDSKGGQCADNCLETIHS